MFYCNIKSLILTGEKKSTHGERHRSSKYYSFKTLQIKSIRRARPIHVFTPHMCSENTLY
jgi:hypothetical protein